MPPISLLDLATVLRTYGRGVVCYAHDGSPDQVPIRWDPADPLNLAHLGDTEGEIVFTPNSTTAGLTLPEISGEAQYEATATGENPTLEVPLFLADPALFPVISPTGTAGGGFGRVAPVDERTIVVFPERLFKKPGGPATGYGPLEQTGGVWELDGVALAGDQIRLLGLSIWFWRCYVSAKPRQRFLGGHGDAAKNIETGTFTALMHADMPDGERLYTRGNPLDYDIDVEGVVPGP